MKNVWSHITQERLLWWCAALLVGALFLNLGVQPLFLEEPRRILIGLEMLENGNLWVPTELGEPYYKKPPLFNWLLLLAGQVLGYHEWAFRTPTVLATLALALLVGWAGVRYVDRSFGWLSGLFFATGGGILLYFSTLAEIDLVYSLITFASFISFFHFYQQKQYLAAFLLVYAVGALGTLTKGLPSVFFTGLTVLAWLAWRRDLLRLFNWRHLLGVSLYLGLVGGYLAIYAQYHPLENLLTGAWKQNSEFTVLENNVLRFIRHLFTFPLDTLKDLLPAGLLVVFALRRDFWRVVRQNELITFALITFLVNIPVYWFSPGAAQRYIYMLYPFLVYIFLYCYRAGGFKTRWRSVFLRVTTGILIGGLALGSLAVHFIPDLAFLSWRLPLSVAGFLSLAIVFFLYWKRPDLILPVLILTLVIARLLFDLTILPQRAHDSKAQADRELARKVTALVEDRPLYIYKDQRISFTTVVYLDLWRDRYLRRHYEVDSAAFYFIEKAGLGAADRYESFLAFEYAGKEYLLIRFLE